MYSLHWHLNHPSVYQLIKAVDTKFFILERDKKIKQIFDSCSLCQSVKHIPEEIHNFKPNEVPDHPGQSFTVDILRTACKKIMVVVENFSGFIVTDFVNSEKREDILDGLIRLISPFKSGLLTRVRVDQAPAFKSLVQRKVEIDEIGFDLELGEAKNKNANAIVDRKIQELEQEIKKCSPAHNVINTKILAKASQAVNEKVRNHGLSAREILFSRDQLSSKNLELKDTNIKNRIMKSRTDNNPSSARSKADILQQAKSAGAREGNVVFLKHDGNKLQRRDSYLVIDRDDIEQTVIICKIINTGSNISFSPQRFRYKVKQTDVYLAPNQPEIIPAIEADINQPTS